MAASLSQILASLEQQAPPRFAEAWDNVGLLLEPVPVEQAAPVSRVLLTIDLSDDVVSEAEALGATLIIAYHPPIFQGLKRLRSSDATERALLRCVARGIALYSPHTALDAAPRGVNDWLLDAFGPGERAPCLPHVADARFGQGRGVRLTEPVALADAVLAIKRHLGLAQLRVAAAPAHAAGGALLQSVAVCAGAGGSVFEKLSDFDLYLTGEMRHHDVRARVLSGSSVVLCDHTNSERGFLPVLAARLQNATSGVQFHLAACDRDPLSIV